MKSKIAYRLLLIAVMLFFNCQKHQEVKGSDLAANISHQSMQKGPDKYLLVGEWFQVGTPYRMKIKAVNEAGGLDVEFFDPKKINIIKASWQKEDINLSVYIELEDEFYENSWFKLNYVPSSDKLIGDFFDTMEDRKEIVEFVRVK